MLAFLQYLIAFLISRDGVGLESGVADTWGIVAAVALYWAAAIGFSWLAGRRPQDAEGPPAQAVLGGMAGMLRIAGLLAFYGIADGLNGRFLAETLGLERVVLLPDLLRLAPFLALTLANRSALTVAAMQMGHAATTGVRLVLEEALAALLPLGPVLVLVTVYDVLTLVDPTSPAGTALAVGFSSPVLQVVFSLSVIALVLLVVPFGVRLLVRAHPLPAGPLRDRLEAYGKRVGFRARDILVWPTTEALNAAVIGALPRFRYVLVTQALLDTLEPDEIEAVYAHEAGHARRGHILLFFGFTATLPLALLFPQLMPTPIAAALTAVPSLLRVVAMVVIWFGVVFGWISRRFEQEADVYGLETLGPDRPLADEETHPFARALERIADEAPEMREVTGWRHFSIGERVAFVRSYTQDPEVRRETNKAIGKLRLTLLVVIGGLVALTALEVPGEVQRVRARYASLQDPEVRVLTALALLETAPSDADRAALLTAAAQGASEAGRHEESLRWGREAVALAPRDPRALERYAEALLAAGRSQGAAMIWARIAALPDAPSALREEAARRARTGQDPERP